MGYDFGFLRDRSRTKEDILENIEQLLAQQVASDPVEIDEKASSYDDGGTSGTRMMDSSRYIVLETANMDEANPDGTITLEPGDEEAILRFNRDVPIALQAIGAVDVGGVTYEIRINNERTVGGQTSGPLGTVNDPFSFVEKLGAAVPAESMEYVATYPPSQSGSVDLAARAHFEVLG